MPMQSGVGCGGTLTAPSSANQCRFWVRHHGATGEPSTTNGVCHRFPTPEWTHQSYWCDEYKAPGGV